MENIYKQLLSLYVCECTTLEGRMWMLKPVQYKNYIIATNGNVLLYINKNKIIDNDYQEYDIPDNVSKYFVLDSNCDRKLTLNELERQLSWCKQEHIITHDYETCPECNGEGVVSWEYEDRNCETHYIDYDCPICQGEGQIDKGIISDELQYCRDETINIENFNYSARNIERIVKSMKLLNINEISIFRNNVVHQKPIIIKFNDDIKLLMMPSIY